MTAKNDITGDSIKSKPGDQKKYAEGFDKIFKKKLNTDYSFSKQMQDELEPIPEKQQEIIKQQQDPRHNQD